MVKQDEIYWIDFGEPQGSEPGVVKTLPTDINQAGPVLCPPPPVHWPMRGQNESFKNFLSTTNHTSCYLFGNVAA